MESRDAYYWLGFITADGTIINKQRGVRIEQKDKDIVILFANTFNLHVRKTKHGNKTYYASQGNLNVEFMRFLLDNGLVSNKTMKEVLPNMPVEYVCHYIRGLIDGDGGIYHKHGTYVIHLCLSPSFGQSVITLITSLTNIEPKVYVYKTRRNNPYLNVRFTGLNAYLLGQWLYSEKASNIERKHQSWLHIKNRIEKARKDISSPSGVIPRKQTGEPNIGCLLSKDERLTAKAITSRKKWTLNELLKDTEKLRWLYIDMKLSMREISSLYGFKSIVNLGKYMRKNNIFTRSSKEGKSISNSRMMLTPCQAAEGLGSAEGVETTRVSPNNNLLHECPSPVILQDDDIVRYSNESLRVSLNS